MKKSLYLCLSLVVVFVSNSFSQRSFEGRSRLVSAFNNVEWTKDEKKDIWYVSKKDDYYTHEEHLFDTSNIAYYRDSISKVMDEEDEAILKKTGVDYGFYHGMFYIPRKERNKEIHDEKDYYRAYIGVDLNRFNVRVSYRGFNNQYVMDYNIDHKKDKIVYFRFFTDLWFDVSAINIRAEIQKNKLVITNHYNKQTLTLTISAYESGLAQKLRKIGINKKPLSVFLIPPAVKKKK